MGFKFTGNFFIKQIVRDKKGEFFLKKLEKLVEFILEEEKISQDFPDILPVPAPKKKKETNFFRKISVLPNYTTTVAQGKLPH
jgi:hypothetical protein